MCHVNKSARRICIVVRERLSDNKSQEFSQDRLNIRNRASASFEYNNNQPILLRTLVGGVLCVSSPGTEDDSCFQQLLFDGLLPKMSKSKKGLVPKWSKNCEAAEYLKELIASGSVEPTDLSRKYILDLKEKHSIFLPFKPDRFVYNVRSLFRDVSVDRSKAGKRLSEAKGKLY